MPIRGAERRLRPRGRAGLRRQRSPRRLRRAAANGAGMPARGPRPRLSEDEKERLQIDLERTARVEAPARSVALRRGRKDAEIGAGALHGGAGAHIVRAGRSVAQSGSALDWGSRGRRFESSRSDQFHPKTGPCRPFAPVAQWIERRASNAKVGSSILSGRAKTARGAAAPAGRPTGRAAFAALALPGMFAGSPHGSGPGGLARDTSHSQNQMSRGIKNTS